MKMPDITCGDRHRTNKFHQYLSFHRGLPMFKACSYVFRNRVNAVDVPAILRECRQVRFELS
jgi:hypothetical protein